jgi:peptidyl-prolyl cis-trans isomerase B (cyclophilin B)
VVGLLIAGVLLIAKAGTQGPSTRAGLAESPFYPRVAGRIQFCFASLPVIKALMETDAGAIHLELFDADAPGTVANFVKLANDGFYDGLAFHRVIDGFMAQGGCPNSREGARGMAGTGGPGYTIPCEINSNKHQAGSLSMAHAGKNTGGSQFFLCHGPQPHLDGVHTVFGHTGDLDVVLKLRNGSRIQKVTIQEA